MDTVFLMSLFFIALSLVIFYWFGKFTLNLIKQHYNVYPLLYELEEQEKKKKR